MKRCLRRLKITLAYRELCGNYHFVTIVTILGIVAICKKDFAIGLMAIGLLIYIGWKSWRIGILIVIVLLIVTINIVIRKTNYQKESFGKLNKIVEVIKVKKMTTNYQITVNDKKVKYLFYHDEILEVGDILNIQGTLTPALSTRTPNGFNYANYLENNNIKGIVEVENLEVVEHRFNFYSLNNLASKYYDLNFPASIRGYLKALVIGNKDDLDDNMMSKIQHIGISHLFVISGLHLGFILTGLSLVLNKTKVPIKWHFSIVVSFFILYYVISGGMISVMRVLLGYVLGQLNVKYRLRLRTLDIYAINVLLILIVNPYQLFSYAFILTYAIATSIVLLNPLLRKGNRLRDKLINNLIISTTSILITIPIIVNINPQVNFLAIIFNLIYIPLITYVVLPLSIVVTFLPFLAFGYSWIILIFEGMTKFLSSLKVGNIIFPQGPLIGMGVYYYLLWRSFAIFEKGKIPKYQLMIMLILMLGWINLRIFNPNDEIYFLDLPVGEATLISDRMNKMNILIDTGENVGTDLEMFLMKKGVKRLDYVFITHSDSDHNGKLPYLLANFRVNNLIISPYDHVSKAMVAPYSKVNVHVLKAGDSIKLSDTTINILAPLGQSNEPNNNSLVFVLRKEALSILFTGDIEKDIEKTLLEKYQRITVDILKIPHHGSLTSSSRSLFELVDFKIAVGMSGYRNTFGFPNKIVQASYNSYQTYFTTDYATIMIKRSMFTKKTKIIPFKK